MNNTNNKRRQASENRYAVIAAALKKSVFPQAVEIGNEDCIPELFQAFGLERRSLFAAVAMASLAHAVVTTRPAAGGTLRPGWTHRVATEAAELAYHLDEALDEIEKNGEPAKDSKQ